MARSDPDRHDMAIELTVRLVLLGLLLWLCVWAHVDHTHDPLWMWCDFWTFVWLCRTVESVAYWVNRREDPT